MEVNYAALLVDNKVPLTDKATIYIPTIGELLDKGEADFRIYSRVFVTTVREQFSGLPEDVDSIEEKYPTMWDIAFDDDMSKATGEVMFGEGIDILSTLVAALCYWTHSELDDFRVLSNKKIVNEKLDWIIDKDAFEELCAYISMITLNEPDPDLIAYKGISSHPEQWKHWKITYEGRLRQRTKQKGKGLGDKIMVLEAYAPTFIPFKQIAEMTYYQFMNLLNTYSKRYAADREMMIYTSQKFDTEKMEMTDLGEDVSLIKLNNN